MRRVTFSRNYTLSLSRTCRCYCKYCAFATHQPHLHEPDEVERRLDDAARRGVKELLVLTGELPESNPEVAERLRRLGHEDFTSYVIWACERGLERGMLPHSNLGVLSRADLERLREVNASHGADARVGVRAPDGDGARGFADQAPARAVGDDRGGGELRIPFTSGILVGIGETEDERIASLDALAEVHARHGHLQEVIIQNFVPHPHYYGREVADIADLAARRRWDGGASDGDGAAVVTGDAPLPEWATPVTLDDMRRLVRRLPRADARRRHPDPAEPVGLVAAARGRRRDRPRRPVGQRRPHLAGAPVPEPARGPQALQPRGYALTERLCVYPQYIDPEWIGQGVLDTIKLKYWSFIPRRGLGPARRRRRSGRTSLRARSSRRATTSG